MSVRRSVIFTFVLAAITALAVGLSSCDRMPPMMTDTETPSVMDGEISIGLLTSLTGIHTEPYGLPMQRGFELA